MSKQIKQVYKIKAPISKVWQALVNPIEINAWGGGPAKMDDKPGTEFSLWGGDIWGKNNLVLNENKLVQDWFGGNWDKPSLVTFELEENDGITKVTLTHENLPDNEVDNFDTGWKDYYMGAIQDYLENK